MSPKTLLSFCSRCQHRWLEMLQQLVNIDSGSDDPAGLTSMIRHMQSHWQGLGFSTEVLQGQTGPHLVAKRFSKRKEAPTFLLLGHVDTVFERGTAHQRPFTAKDGRAY